MPFPTPLAPRQPDPAVERGLLAPACGLAILVVIVVALAGLRQPLSPWLPFIAALAVIGLVWCLRQTGRLGAWLGIAAAASWTVLAVISQRAAAWTAMSTNPDAWSYSAMASYLTDYSRGVTQGMPLVDQFASHLRNTRFASAGLLAVASFFSGNNQPFVPHVVFYVISVVTLVFSIGYLAETLGLSRRQSLVAGALVALLGWTADSIIVASYDNLVFVALWPAALGVLLQFHEGKLGMKSFLAAESALGAALVSSYPEGLAIAAIMASPLACFMAWRNARNPRFWAGLAGAVVIALLLASPYLPILLPFVKSQMAMSATSGARPGEGYFIGLLGRGFLPAFFSLGSEFPGSSTALVYDIVPAAATALTVLGVWRLSRRWPWYPWVGASFILLLLWQAAGRHYSYGAYKVIICASWWIYPAMVSGGAWLIGRAGRPWIGGTATAGLFVAAGFQQHSQWPHRIWAPDHHLEEIANLASVPFVTQGHAVLVALDSDFEQYWAVSMLRSVPLVLDHPRGYLAMPHVQPYLARACAVPREAGMYVLRSGSAPKAVWQNARFSLAREFDALIASVDNPNGMESMDGAPFIWIAATRPTIFSITVFLAGHYDLDAQAFLFGPSAPANPQRKLEVSDASGVHTVVITMPGSAIPLVLRRGENRVGIRSITPVAVDRLPNGDPRELMLGLKGYFLKNESP